MKLVLAIIVSLYLAFPVLAKEACDRLEVDFLTSPAQPGNKFSFFALERTVVPPSASFVIIGDSIANQIYEGRMGTLLNAEDTFVLAGGGDGFQNALFRLNYFRSKLETIAPQKVLIVLGTNNMGFSSCAIETAFDGYFNKLKSLWVNSTFYVLPVLPRGDNFIFNEDLVQYNHFLMTSASRLGYVYISVDNVDLTCGIFRSPEAENFFDNYGALTFGETCGGEIGKLQQAASNIGSGVSSSCEVKVKLSCDNFLADNVHLSEKGVIKITDLISREIGKF